MPTQNKSRAAIRYAFDDTNRLIIEDPTDALRPRRIVEGSVRLDRKNRLVYETSSPVLGDAGPRRLVLEGAWSLTPTQQLALTLHETDRQVRSILYVKGAVVQAQAHALTFALRRSEDDDLRATQRLSLAGRWQADARNRLTFLAERADGEEDRLTLQGGWEIGPHHELVYRYRQRAGARHRAEAHALAFEGAWDLTAANRLVYRVEGSTDSAFEFKASLQSPSLVAREGALVYQVGIGVAGGKTQRTRVALYGAWKVNEDLSVSFEIPYAEGRVQAIQLAGTARLGPRNQVRVELRSRRGDSLGLAVTFTRELVPDAELFVRLQKAAEESSVIGGLQVRF